MARGIVWSLRARLVVLVVVAVLPGFGLILHAARSRRLLAFDLLAFGLTSLLAAALAWATGNALIVRRVRALRTAAAKLARGDLATRTGIVHDATELGALAQAFDAMAEAVGARQTALDQAVAELRASEARFRELTEHIREVFWLVSADRRRLIYVSPGYEEIWGRSRASLHDNPLLFLEAVHRDDRARVEAALDRQGANQLEHEYRIVRPDGSVRWVRSRSFPVTNDRGLVERIAGITEDVSNARRAEEELARQREALAQREKLAAMTSLLAGVAHELSNPLTVVIGHTQRLCLLTEGTDGPLAMHADKAASAAERCARILRNFLAVARKHPEERGPVDLNQTARDAVELLVYSLRVDDVEVRLDLQEGLPELWGDAQQIHQVLVNLIANAHHAMRDWPGLRRLTVASRADPARGTVTFSVADTGAGIASETLPRIFEPFFTTKPLGQGTGLGLSLCQGIVEAHGGAIRVASAPGQGARFEVELPSPAGRAPAAAAAAEPPPVPGRAILVVEDEPEIASLLVDVLTADSHHVEAASSGAAALEMLAQHTYDVIVSDVKMPELDGPGLYRALAKQRPDLCRRLIFLTGDTLSTDTAAFVESAGVPCLQKPLDLRALVAAVRRALQASAGVEPA